MKSLLVSIVVAVLLVGCGESHPHRPEWESQQSATPPESKSEEPIAEATQPEPPTTKAPDISIHDAVRKGNVEAIKQHLVAGTDVNLKDAKWGNTPMIHAAYHGKHEIIDYLVQQRADLNAQSNNGWTALHVAVGQEHLGVVGQLLRAGADVTVRNRLFGQGGNQEQVFDTPLDLAINFDLPEITQLLRKHGAQTNAELKAKGQ